MGGIRLAAIVAAAFVLANQVGTRQLTDAETMAGESATAQQSLGQNRIRQPASETVSFVPRLRPPQW